MTDFLTELEELFNTFKEEELKILKQDNNSLLQTLMKSEFFRKEYTQQQFKKSKRFRNKTYYNFRGYPVKLNTTKEMKLHEKYEYFKVEKTKNYKTTSENFNFDKLKSSEIKVKELILFTQGSRTKSQFECWTPMEMFLWWRTLRESSDPKLEWKIMDAVFFLFINQISQIINTYVINFYLKFYSTIVKKREKNYSYSYIKKYKINKYTNTDVNIIDPYLKSLFYLKKYLEGLDKFYESGGEYGLLLDVQLLYYEYYDFELYLDNLRHFNNDYKKVRLLRESQYAPDFYLYGLFQNNNENVHRYVPERIYHSLNSTQQRTLERLSKNNKNINLFKIFQETLKDNNYSLVIFQSYFQNSAKYISLYSIPVIAVLGIEYDTHEGRTYTSLDQITHDLGHSNYLIYFLENLYKNLQKDEDIQEFFRRTIFLEALNKTALEEKMKLIKGNENNNFSIKRIYKGILNTNENKKFKESEEKNSKKPFTSDSQKLLWWFLHEKKFNLHEVGFSDNVVKEVAINFFDIQKLKEKLKILIKQVKSNKKFIYVDELSGNHIHYNQPNGTYISSIGFLPKSYFNEHKLDIEAYNNRVIRSINILIEICDFVLRQDLRYDYRNNNNNNNTKAVYGNINNNKVNKKVDKYLKKHPEFTNNNLQEYANNYKIGKIYNTNNENNISRFKVDFIKRVKKKQKISTYIPKFIENNSIPNLNMDNNNASTKKQTNLRTLSNQRKAFIKGIVNNPNGSPLTNNNYSILNHRNLNNT